MESVSRFCGIATNDSYTVWDSSSSTFGQCFLWTGVSCASHSLFLVTSAYLHGTTDRLKHQKTKSWSCIIHILIGLLLCCSSITEAILSYILRGNHPPAYVLSKSVTFTTWILCAWLNSKIMIINQTKKEIIKVNLMFFLPILTSSTMQIHATIKHIMNDNITLDKLPIAYYGNLVYFFFNILFTISSVVIIFSREKRNAVKSFFNESGSIQAQDDEQNYDDNTTLLSSDSSYITFEKTKKKHKIIELGVGESTSNIFSKITFWWVNKIIMKGYNEELEKPEDLALLPEYLTTNKVKETFINVMQRCQKYQREQKVKDGSRYHWFEKGKQPKMKRSLLKTLHKTYAWYLYALGLVRLMIDLSGFAQPLLLNALVKYMENKEISLIHGNKFKEPSVNGYYYAIGLLLATAVQIVLDLQFRYYLGKCCIKVRAALVTLVYDKTLAVNSSTIAAYSTGQVINFMSTDAERVVSFFRCFHPLWSFPFQIAVSMFLLYQQVGISFLGGTAFVALLIPMNKIIARKISKLHQANMKQKDERVKIISEILNGIRIIKLYAWENCFIKKVNQARNLELKVLKLKKYLVVVIIFLWDTTPIIMIALTFSTYVLLGNQLTAATVFTSVALFKMLITPLNAFPWVLNGIIEAWISQKRLQEYISQPELCLKDYYTKLPDNGSNETALKIEKASFHWQSTDSIVIKTKRGDDVKKNNNNKKDKSKKDDERGNNNEDGEEKEADTHVKEFYLRDINAYIQKGELIGITGRVGSGKTSLFASVIAETEKDSGYVYIGNDFSGFGFVAQESWIQHLSIKDNILFGQEFDQERYENVLYACALKEDLDIFPAGDQTEVGENGVTLSGGQKARIALARAVYQDKEVYLLDDPLAAVDVHVAAHIFQHCIMGLLKKKTRLLCTHHVKYLWQADKVLLMKDGYINAWGAPGEVLTKSSFIERQQSQTSQTGEHGSGEQDPETQKGEADQMKSNNNGKFIEEEEREKGKISSGVVKVYWYAVGSFLAINILVVYVLAQAALNLSDWWLAYWISHSQSHNNNTVYHHWHVAFNHSHLKSDVKFYLIVYGCIGGGSVILTLIRAFLFTFGGIKAAKVLHDKLLDAMMEAPIPFFDKTPIGRIVNRFSSDVFAVDDSFPHLLEIVTMVALSVIGTIIMTCYGIPWFACVLVPLAAVYYYIQHYYRKSSRELKRLCTITRSPIYAHFSETLSGLMTIRAFRETDRFTGENEKRLELNQRANYCSFVATLWLALRLNMISVIMVTSVSFLAVIEHNYSSVNPGLVGLAISYALSITYDLSGFMNVFTESEKQLISVERLNQSIKDTPKEDLGTNLGNDSEVIMLHGTLSFKEVFLKYRPELPYAIQDVSFDVNAGEKIGICGRTGSGKSSIMRLIFKILNVTSGEVKIDGINIQNLDVKKLRSKMAIIPQEPFLFDDTVEKNLDPEELYTTFELLDVLEKCHLAQVAQKLGGLQGRVGERGNNLSAGQKQLMCLARALLKKSKIICIDEATASVDMETDKLVQQTIREEFGSSTVLTIAHRVETIMDSDRVLVMDNGRVSEFDAPSLLLDNRKSLFYALVQENKKVKK